MEEQMVNNNAPKLKMKSGNVELAVWENSGTTNEGKKYVFSSFQIKRNYQDKDGNWQSTQSYKAQDLPRIISLLQIAYDKDTIKEE